MPEVADRRNTDPARNGVRVGLHTAERKSGERLGCFRHESFFYSGEGEFLAGTLPLIEQALELGRPVLVAVAPARIALLREALVARPTDVGFVDMHELGRNPARAFSGWQQFLEDYASVREPLLGIGEPVWPGRSAAELAECQRSEALLNLAFAGTRPWRLLCLYDLDGLDAQVIEAARHSHPYLAEPGASSPNALYSAADCLEGVFAGALPPPAARVQELEFSRAQLAPARHLVAARAARAGLARARCDELVLAVSELTANSVRHGGGTGWLRVWRERRTLLCEVQDAGHIEVPLAGRLRPRPEQLTGRGLWLVNQLCDLVQIRSDHTGTVARLHMDLLRPD
jgi:anti-sigma regulatory factor (Ser/Thr protein kinase)